MIEPETHSETDPFPNSKSLMCAQARAAGGDVLQDSGLPLTGAQHDAHRLFDGQTRRKSRL
jgi:hypothetical protein